MTEWSMDDAMSALDPHFDEIDAVCRNGLAFYQKYPPEIRLEHSARSAAACTYDHMVAEAERRLSGLEGIVFRDIQGLKVWVIGEKAVIRFKKMDEDGRSRNYPTKQAKDYDRQQQLPGLPFPPLNLVAGYLPDATGTAVIRVQVARPLGKTINWCAAIVPVDERKPGAKRWTVVSSTVPGL
jgi:hypothetical protein